MTDKNIFENGWDEYNAYIFGWIMSDGSLVKHGRNKNKYRVIISSNDFEILEWMHKYIDMDNKIYKIGKNGFCIHYRNQEAIEFMMEHNLIERKSLTVEFPNIPDKYISMFIRGYFDGNGSVILSTSKYGTHGQISFACGSKNFINSLNQVLDNFNIVSHIYKDNRANNSSYDLRITKRIEIEKFYKFIYDNSNIKLDRKYQKYKHLIDCKPKYNIGLECMI